MLNDDSSDDSSSDESSLASSPPAKRMRRRYVDTSSYGLPPPFELSPPESMQVKIYHFEELPQARGEYILPNSMKALGHTWKLMLYPRGRLEFDEDCIALCLSCPDVMEDSNKKIKTLFKIELGSKYILHPYN